MSNLEAGKPGVVRLATAALVALVVALVVGAFWFTGRGADPASPETLPKNPRVIVISMDGLASYAVTRAQMPVLTRLRTGGASTLNARTAVERTVTLPNHTGMVTGRKIDAAVGGHGVTWNVASARNVRADVPSVFTVIHAAGGQSAVFVGKGKFRMWKRSWPGTIDRFAVEADLPALTDAVLADLGAQRRDLTFFHIAAPDVAGHASGWDSPAYDAAVTASDRALGKVVKAVESDPDLARDTIIVVTADHGGPPGLKDHGDATALVDFQIPFVVWGPGVAARDLYDINPDYTDPGDAQPSYDGPQPVRNAAVANLVTGLLGLDPVPGSQIDLRQDLGVVE
ncbi:MAG: alkaline phosphatase [Propionibacteriales bacterium]|nr:alkaline phosphatase [Propionibacteriales bacterium]